MDKTLYGLLMGKIKSVSQDFRDLMSRQEKQDERIKNLENYDGLYFLVVAINGKSTIDLRGNELNELPDVIKNNIDDYFLAPLTRYEIEVEWGIYEGQPRIYLRNYSNNGLTFLILAIRKENVNLLYYEPIINNPA